MTNCSQTASPNLFEAHLSNSVAEIEGAVVNIEKTHVIGPMPPVAKKSVTEKRCYLSIGTQPSSMYMTLVDHDPNYWTWMRLVMMRCVKSAISMGFDPAQRDTGLLTVLTVMKIFNGEAFEFFYGQQGLYDALDELLLLWETEIPDAPVFPVQLKENLECLAKLICLDDTEKAILGLAVLIHAEGVLGPVQYLIGTLRAHQVPRLIAVMLKIPQDAVEKALDPQGPLARSDLLVLDYFGSGNLNTRVDLISGRFAGWMLRKHDSIFSVLAGLVELVQPPELCLDDYKYMADRLSTLTNILANALDTRRVGVNILVWGQPGLGKSQLARVIAQSVKRDLVQISSKNSQFMSISPMLRFKIYRMAQAMFDPQEAFILFDECEEVFSTQGGFTKDADDHITPQKSWIHDTLETNRTPTIWVCNAITDLTAAQIRRFDACIKMEAPTGAQRLEMYTAIAGNTMSNELLAVVVKSSHMTPAVMSKTAMLVNLISNPDSVLTRDQLALQLINDKFIAIGHTVIKAPNKHAITFRPEFVNTTLALDKMVLGLKKHHAGRFLLSGPAGTGKSAFGKWLAEELGIPHLVFRSSALLGKYVGETEEKIAAAFEQANRESAVLQIDEIDTFLDDRTSSKHAWQVSMTNELLTQIEAYEGLLVTTTNLFSNIDDAAKRRFDLNLEFGYLRPDDAVQMLQETCAHFDLELATAEETRSIRSLGNLTAGDFQQVIGQSRFIQPESANDLLNRIKDATSLKKFGHTTKMGFLRAA